MPAKSLQRTTNGGTYCHVYNKGVENRILFVDETDYQAFLGYLEDYLCAPKTPESTKKEFTVNGRVFSGVPHQPKNYFNKIELVAYSLKPNHFHLLLRQNTPKSLQAFIRSLCTRYSIYFNKKYNRTGALFDGPYKSVHIEDEKSLPLLTRYFDTAGGYSSLSEYSGQNDTSWVKTKVVLSVIGNTDNYKDYINNYKLTSEEKDILGKITIDDDNQHHERRDLEAVSLKPWSRIPELATASAVLVLLLGLGLKNISTISKSNPAYPVTLGTSTTTVSPSPTPSPQPNIKSEVSETEATSGADIKPVNSDD